MQGSFEPGFKLDLMKKDVNLALESARGSGTAPPLDLRRSTGFRCRKWCWQG